MPILDRLKHAQHIDDSEVLSSSENATNAIRSKDAWVPGGFRPAFRWRVLGTPAPVFPGFEVDICDRVPDEERPDAVWHRERARGMLRDHPEIRDLFGHAPSTAIWCMLFSAAQIGVALVVTTQPWWVVLLVAYLIGSWINVCLFMLGHECNHCAVFNSKTWDHWLFTLTTLPMFLPGHHTWWIEHHVHHNDFGAKKDFVKRRRSILLAFKDSIFGVPVPRRLRPFVTWITTPLCWPIAGFMLVTQVLRALVGLIVYAVTASVSRRLTPGDTALSILADRHLISGCDKYGFRAWAVVYPLINLSFLAVVFALGGWKSILYLLLSQLFMTGFLHPVNFGMILNNSHFHGQGQVQASTSYYGWLNWLTFNFGLHTEHHDLEKIPWFRLGKLRKIAPEYYDNLIKTRSYALLGLQFGFGARESFDAEEYRNVEMLAASRTEPVGTEVDGRAASLV